MRRLYREVAEVTTGKEAHARVTAVLPTFAHEARPATPAQRRLRREGPIMIG